MQPRSNNLIEHSDHLKPTTPAALYFVMFIWIFAVLLVYLVLFGPPEFWLLAKQIGINDQLAAFGSWLQPLFTANYLSP